MVTCTDTQLTSGYPSLDAVARPEPGIFDLRVAAVGHGKTAHAATAVTSLARDGLVGFCQVEEPTAELLVRMGLAKGGEFDHLADNVVALASTDERELVRMYLGCFARAAASGTRVAGVVVDHVDLFDGLPSCSSAPVMGLLRAMADGDVGSLRRATGIDPAELCGPDVEFYPVAVIAYGGLRKGYRLPDAYTGKVEITPAATRITRAPNDLADRVTELVRHYPLGRVGANGRFARPEGSFIVHDDVRGPTVIPMHFDVHGARARWTEPTP